MQSNNRKAFLDMLACSEGTATSKYTKNNGYDVIVNGMGGTPHIFTDYSKHPNVLVTVNARGLQSTAAGRYQLLYRYYVAYKASLKLPDFSPASQDAIALQQIKEQGALPMIDRGDIALAIKACCNIWASLPGNNYQQGQRSIAWLIATYRAHGGT